MSVTNRREFPPRSQYKLKSFITKLSFIAQIHIVKITLRMNDVPLQGPEIQNRSYDQIDSTTATNVSTCNSG